MTGLATKFSEFQSTLPVRGATDSYDLDLTCGTISIHAPRAGSDAQILVVDSLPKISIPAPRAGSDHTQGSCGHGRMISIHAPRAGSDYQAWHD